MQVHCFELLGRVRHRKCVHLAVKQHWTLKNKVILILIVIIHILVAIDSPYQVKTNRKLYFTKTLPLNVGHFKATLERAVDRIDKLKTFG